MTYKEELKAIKALTDKNAKGAAFEKWCQILLRDNEMGAEITPKLGWGRDGGIDLIVTRNKHKFATQCKCWNNWALTTDIIDETEKRITAFNCDYALIMMSGPVPQKVIDYGKKRNVRILDDSYLLRLIKEAHHSSCREFCTDLNEDFPDELFCIAPDLKPKLRKNFLKPLFKKTSIQKPQKRFSKYIIAVFIFLLIILCKSLFAS
ncbi:MAG: restriction endonuclease [Oxalobacter sp.]